MELSFFPAPIDVEFELDNGEESHQKEFDKSSQIDEDPIGHWIKLAKAKGDTSEKDQAIVTLLVELHRKIDELTDIVRGKNQTKTPLAQKQEISGIHYEFFMTKNKCFEPNKRYFARIIMPTFPTRDLRVFINTKDEKTAQIVNIHDRDLKEWNAYVAARERVMIRKIREENAH